MCIRDRDKNPVLHAVTIFWLVLGMAVAGTRLGVEEEEKQPQITQISQI